MSFKDSKSNPKQKQNEYEKTSVNLFFVGVRNLSLRADRES
jgi:hypothetical protein